MAVSPPRRCAAGAVYPERLRQAASRRAVARRRSPATSRRLCGQPARPAHHSLPVPFSGRSWPLPVVGADPKTAGYKAKDELPKMSWTSIADLLGPEGEVALVGVPMEAGSVTPGRCDLAPETIRRTLRRVSTYDIDSGRELETRVRDFGDVEVAGLSPAEGFEPI